MSSFCRNKIQIQIETYRVLRHREIQLAIYRKRSELVNRKIFFGG